MNIDPVGKGLTQLRNVRHMRQYPELDLAIVGRQQLMAWGGNEGGADLAAFCRAHRDVLQVRLG